MKPTSQRLKSGHFDLHEAAHQPTHSYDDPMKMTARHLLVVKISI